MSNGRIGGPEVLPGLWHRLTERRIHEDDVVALAHRVDETNRVACLGSKEALGGGRGSRVGGSLKRGEYLRLNFTECVRSDAFGERPLCDVASGEVSPDLGGQLLLNLEKRSEHRRLRQRLSHALHEVAPVGGKRGEERAPTNRIHQAARAR